DLTTHIVTRWGAIKAVDGVSFAVSEGETLGLVGESGSGKSMTCLSILRLVPRPAARILGGQVRLDGDDLLTKSEREMQRIRGKRVAMILQDPMSSLNPVFSIGMQVREPLSSYHALSGRALASRAVELLASVGISSPAARLRAFPHQLSGGMRQRVVGAMAIAAPPRLLIADEPTARLDLTLQAQHLRLRTDLPARPRGGARSPRAAPTRWSAAAPRSRPSSRSGPGPRAGAGSTLPHERGAPGGGGAHQALSGAAGPLRAPRRARARRRLDLVHDRSAQDARPRRWIGLRQDADLADDPQRRTAEERPHPP